MTFGFPVIVLLFLTAVVTTAEVLVPKNKTAKFSSNYAPQENPSLANDGNTRGAYHALVRCFHVNPNEPLSWWLLDMERSYAVRGVRVWNRIDCCAEVFNNVSVGVTSNPSVWTEFNPNLFEVCGFYAGPATWQTNPINFTCARPLAGRYLAVFKYNGDNYRGMHFCEVDVIVFTKQAITMPLLQPTFSADSHSLQQTATSQGWTEAECILRCFHDPGCLFALTKAAGHGCWFFGSSVLPNSFIGVANESGTKFVSLFG